MTLLRSGKTSHEIHLDFVPFPFRNIKWLQSSSRPLVLCFNAAANVTLRNITSNVLLHIRPPVSLTNVMVHLCATRVNRQRSVMSFFHNVFPLILVLGYEETVLEE